MRTQTSRRMLAIPVVLLGIALPSRGEEPGRAEFQLDTVFAYQGRLKQGGGPANGVYDFEFELRDRREGGTFLGRLLRFDHVVSKGVFEGST